MSPKSFFQTLLIVSAGTAAVLAGLHYLAPQAQQHCKFAIGSVMLFALVCTGLYYAGASTARSKNKHAFTNLVSVSVFGKMVVALAALFIYQQVAVPSNQWFVGIFLWCYVVFTAFEVWFMTKLAKV
ncbi:MAG: hypothetical protein Q7T20_11815 [Saprospiraceae bacterium]|nr:hypothetical protein [Saprospiraceae bacterium]